MALIHVSYPAQKSAFNFKVNLTEAKEALRRNDKLFSEFTQNSANFFSQIK